MNEEFRASIHKELMAGDRSLAAKYVGDLSRPEGPLEPHQVRIHRVLRLRRAGRLRLSSEEDVLPAALQVGRQGLRLRPRHHLPSSPQDQRRRGDVHRRRRGPRRQGRGERGHRHRRQRLRRPERHPQLQGRLDLSWGITATSPPTARSSRRPRCGWGSTVSWPGTAISWPEATTPSRDLATPVMFQPSLTKGGIRIGDDVWLGAGVIVLDGVTIGRSSVVGAGSVVTGPGPGILLRPRRPPAQDPRPARARSLRFPPI